MSNILIINEDNGLNFIGGIKRVSLILAEYWQIAGHECIFLNVTDAPEISYVKGYKNFDIPLCQGVRYCDDVVEKVGGIVRDCGISIVVNQHSDVWSIADILGRVRERCGVKVLSVLHFSPSHDIDITKDSFFNTYRLGVSIKAWTIDMFLWLKYHLLKKRRLSAGLAEKYRFIYRNSDKVILLSNNYIPKFKSIAGIVSNEKLLSINNPMCPHRDEMQCKEKKVVWVGRVGYDMKRTDIMLKIWKEVSLYRPDWKLYILGSGQVDNFRNICRKYDINNVEIKGFSNPFEYYPKASIICSTSVSEGLPMVLLEGMSYGCVPISFDSFASITDIITDGEDGYIVDALNRKNYVNRLLKLMSNDDLRNRMSGKTINKINKFEASRIAEKWMKLFETL